MDKSLAAKSGQVVIGASKRWNQSGKRRGGNAVVVVNGGS